MIELDEAERRAVDTAGDSPPRVTDPSTNAVHVLLGSADFDWVRGLLRDEADAPRRADSRTGQTYALVPAERYERFKAFFEEDPITSAERKNLLRTAGLTAGWDDPAFNIYDEASRIENVTTSGLASTPE